MNAEEKYLLRLGFDNPVMNADEYPLNNSQNAEKWLYLSDILREYHAQQSKGMYTEDELKREVIYAYDEGRTDEYNYGVFCEIQNGNQYWKSIKPKK